MITPFDENGDVDEEGFRENIRSQIDGGIDGIVPVGTTGECATLSHEEHMEVVEIAIDAAAGDVPVIAGTGSNNTKEALELTRHAAEAGADAAMLVTPYYNKPTQRGLYEHYKTVAQEVDIPQIIYNVPSRTGRNVDPETLISLSEFENIIGVKEAITKLDQIMEIVENTGEEFQVLSGNDSQTLPMLSLGGVGAISVASNIIPGKISKLVHSYLEGDIQTAQNIHYENLPLFRALFLETNPAPVKAAMEILDKPSGGTRLPLVEVTKETKNRMREVLSELGITPEE